jgi:hypothetical protein
MKNSLPWYSPVFPISRAAKLGWVMGVLLVASLGFGIPPAEA